jgi:hypothetical protein
LEPEPSLPQPEAFDEKSTLNTENFTFLQFSQ